MKIIAISDTHNKQNKLTIPECDILIHAGDMTSLGHEHEIRAFFKWFKKQPAKHHVCILGNHEKVYEQVLPLSEIWITEEFPDVILLENNEVTIEGLRIWGSPVTPFFHNWAYNVHRGDDIKKYWEAIPSGLDILITHGPAKYILDKSVYDGFDCGCEELRTAILEKSPKIHLFGHIHHWGGQNKKLGETTCYNVSLCDEDYVIRNPITIIEL